MPALKWRMTFLSFVLTMLNITTTEATHNESRYFQTHLERSSFIFGLMAMANQTNVNTLCHTQLKHIERGILRKEPWAMKVLDASGSKLPGFTFGQNYWLGSREACEAVQNILPLALSQRFERNMYFELLTDLSPFEVDYRVLYLKHNSPWQVEVRFLQEQVIHIGLCLPRSCTSDDVIKIAGDYLQSGLFVDNALYDIRPDMLYIKDLRLNPNFYQKRSLKMMIAVVAFTGAMILCAAILRAKSNLEQSKRRTSEENVSKSVNGVIRTTENSTTSSGIKMFIQCFDVQANLQKMFEIKKRTSNDIPAINGLRSVYAFFVVSVHVPWFTHFTMTNKAFLATFVEPLSLPFCCLVDVFFMISGFLHVYNFIRNTKQMEIIRGNNLTQNLKAVIKIIFHRLLRLAPSCFVITCLSTLMYAYYADTSVFHIDDRSDENCSKFWWRNVFHIQNLFHYKELCIVWTWSLAAEIQFFVLSTILLLIYTKYPTFSRTATWVLLTYSILCYYIVGYNVEFQFNFDVVWEVGTETYLNPNLRVLPYIIGALAGGFLAERQSQLKISAKQEQFIWYLVTCALLLINWPTNKGDLSWLKSISILAMGRLISSVSVCWIIMASATGRSCWWSRFLEARVFQHLNRLTYTIYLANAFVITLFIGATSTGLDFSVPLMAVLVPGFFFLIYLTSVILSLCFEIPYCNWSSRSLKCHKVKNE